MKNTLAKTKALLIKHSKLVISLICVALIICFLARGWIRTTFAPAYANWRYSDSVKETYMQVDKELGYPLQSLEFKGEDTSFDGDCELYTAYRFYIEIGCDRLEVGQTSMIDRGYKQRHKDTYKQLEAKLMKDQWEKSSTDIPVADFEDLLNGDSGFIRYDKQINGNNCTLEFARFEYMHGYLACDRMSRIGIDW